MIAYLERISSILKSKLSQIIKKGIAHSIDDTKPVQTLQVGFSQSDVQDEVLRIQNFGFTSFPPKDSDAYILFPNGDRNTGLAFGVESFQDRLKGLSEGESALYSLGPDNKRATIIVRPNGKVSISNGTQNLAQILERVIRKVNILTVSVVAPSAGNYQGTITLDLTPELEDLQRLLE